MKALNITAFAITLLGVLNWLIIGIFNWSFVAAVFGIGAGTRVVYMIYAVAGLWLLGSIMNAMRKRSVSRT